MMVLRRFPFRRADAPLVLALLFAGVAHTEARAQNVATVRVEENLRAEPQGTIIGRLMEGTALPVVRVDGNWVLVNVQGWVWTQSLLRTERQGFDLTV